MLSLDRVDLRRLRGKANSGEGLQIRGIEIDDGSRHVESARHYQSEAFGCTDGLKKEVYIGRGSGISKGLHKRSHTANKMRRQRVSIQVF